MLGFIGRIFSGLLALYIIPLIFSPVLGGYPEWTKYDIEEYAHTNKNKVEKGKIIPIISVKDGEYNESTIIPLYLRSLRRQAGNILCIHHPKLKKQPKRIFIYDFIVFHGDGKKQVLMDETMPLEKRTRNYDTSENSKCDYGGFKFAENKQSFSVIIRATVEMEDGSYKSFSVRRTLLYHIEKRTKRIQVKFF